MVADALSIALSMVDAKILGFEQLKECYKDDPDFLGEFEKQIKDCVEQDGYLFKGNKLCVSKGGVRELLVREVHNGGLGVHFGVQKHLIFWLSISIGQE